jgi:hypothetical protein
VDIAKSVPSKLGRRYHCGGVIVTACGCALIANFRFVSWLLSRTFDHCSMLAMLGPVPEVDAARALTKIVYAENGLARRIPFRFRPASLPTVLHYFRNPAAVSVAVSVQWHTPRDQHDVRRMRRHAIVRMWNQLCLELTP